jgi:lipid II:glycine glycyltransferase (peptidoglycan interpeptide bridge formation enzyme)
MKTDRTIRLVTEDDKEAWDRIADHPLQTWEWGEARKAMGIDVVRLGIFEKKSLVDGWQITFHNIPCTPYCIGYFPKGPKITHEMITELKKIGISKHALYIQLEPNIPAEEVVDFNESSLLRPSHRPLFTKYTFVLDLTKSEEELLKAMHPKTRYNIKVAERHGVVIKEDNSDSAFSSYLALSEETTKRQGFYAHDTRYHKTIWKFLRKNNIARLFTATLGKTFVSAWMLFVWKDTVYYPYGASSRSHREVMAPNLLLWEIAKWAKKQGIFYFDLWGAMGPNPDTKDPWYGFHRFKEGYNPTFVEFAGSFDLVIHPFLYTLFTSADSLRWMFLKAKARS